MDGPQEQGGVRRETTIECSVSTAGVQVSSYTGFILVPFFYRGTDEQDRMNINPELYALMTKEGVVLSTIYFNQESK